MRVRIDAETNAETDVETEFKAVLLLSKELKKSVRVKLKINDDEGEM